MRAIDSTSCSLPANLRRPTKMRKTSKTMLVLLDPRGFLCLRRFAGGCAIHHSIQLCESYGFHMSFSTGKPFGEKQKC
jgi:hypothetical protein